MIARHVVLFIVATLVLLSGCRQPNRTETFVKPRVVVTADPELDDLNSLIRLILYSTDFQIEGLIYASSQFHWKGDGKGTKRLVPGREYTRFGLSICPCESWRWAKDERFIHDVVEAYEKVYPNLKVHNPDYPDPAALKEKIRYGNIEFDGDISKESPGSELIKSLILDEVPGKLYLTAWGGQSTIARALKSIQEQYESTDEWASIKAKVLGKVVILPSGDQDDTYRDYIKPNWPGIDYRQFRDGPRYSYGAQFGATPRDSVYLTAGWLKENISDRGPLGQMYRLWGDGKQMVKDDIFDYFGIAGHTSEELKKVGYIVWMPVQPKGSWLGEGDTGTFMNLLANGLRGYEDGTYGGWSGWQLPEGGEINFSQPDSTSGDSSLQSMQAMMNAAAARAREAKTLPDLDFFPAAQHDFATRMKWSVTPNYKDANHEPIVAIKGALNRRAKAGEVCRIESIVSDPDNNQVSSRWWQYPSGTYVNPVVITQVSDSVAELQIPADAKSDETIHIILESTDDGVPALTRYQRVIVTVD